MRDLILNNVNMLPCGMKCVKYTLFAFNLVFAICGIAMIGIGSYTYMIMSNFSVYQQTKLLTPSITLIAVGIVVFLISFLGCYGAVSEHINMLMAFSSLLLIILIIEISFLVIVMMYKGSVHLLLEKNLNDTIVAYTDENPQGWHIIQGGLHCCGVRTQNDWNENAAYSTPTDDNGTFNRPVHCCTFGEDTPPEEMSCSSTSENINQVGCLQVLLQILVGCMMLILIVAGVVCFVEIVAVTMACSLASAIRKENHQITQQNANKVFVNNS